MIYKYVYKTSDGVRHEDTLDAQSREAVFETLRKRGIKAIKVIASDGTKANGEVFVRGIRKRTLAVSLLMAVLIAGGTAFYYGRQSPREPQQADSSAPALPRQWLGDDVKPSFAHPSENLLALFAQPGVEIAQSDLPSLDNALAEDLSSALDAPITINETDDTSTASLKRIVIGLKQEAAVHLRGGANLESLVNYLMQRQMMEAGLRAKIVSDLKKAPASERTHRLKEAVDMITTLGLKPLSPLD